MEVLILLHFECTCSNSALGQTVCFNKIHLISQQWADNIVCLYENTNSMNHTIQSSTLDLPFGFGEKKPTKPSLKSHPKKPLKPLTDSHSLEETSQDHKTLK